MKGMQGLAVAGLLGVLGVALNWIYLQGRIKEIASVSFLGMRADALVLPGQIIQEKHLEPVTVPERNAGNLQDYVYLYKDRGTVVGMKATRRYQGGDLIYREHYRTPPAELKLQKTEKLIWIPVNSNSFVPQLVDPGDMIEFVVPVYSASSARPSPTEEVPADEPPTRVVSTETIGPFRVGSLGNRLASSQVARGNRISTSQEQLVGIVIDTSDPQETQNAERLQGRVLSGQYQNVGVNLLRKAGSEPGSAGRIAG